MKITTKALLSAAYEHGYDDRSLEADHELEDAVAAAKIETLEEAQSTLETWYQTSKHHPIADMNEFANKMFEHRIKKVKK
jgi:hypothetical protein